MERYRTTLIMLALLVALGVTAFLLNNNNAGTNSTPTPEPVRYVWQSSDATTGLDVMSGTQKVILRNDPATASWTVEEPVKGPADSFAVSTIGDAFKSLQATRVLTEGANLADYGLDKDGLSVTATYSSTTTPTRKLLIGGPTFDGAGYYVKTPDSATIYVVSNSTIEPLRSWLASPPLAPPTPTPPQLTIVPTATVTPPVIATSSPGGGAGTLPTTAVLTGSTTVTSTNPITSTSPGAANPTTPIPSASTTP